MWDPIKAINIGGGRFVGKINISIIVLRKGEGILPCDIIISNLDAGVFIKLLLLHERKQ